MLLVNFVLLVQEQHRLVLEVVIVKNTYFQLLVEHEMLGIIEQLLEQNQK